MFKVPFKETQSVWALIWDLLSCWMLMLVKLWMPLLTFCKLMRWIWRTQLATDRPSALVGWHHSVYTLLKQNQPYLQLITGVCYSLDTVTYRAMQQLPSNIEDMIREIYNWFAHSPKCQSDYQTLPNSDADLETAFSHKLEASPLSSERKQVVLTHCTDLLKELLVQYPLHFPASMELLQKLELLCPATVVSNSSPVQKSPTKFFSGSPDSLETQRRNVSSASFSPHLALCILAGGGIF